MHVTVAQRGELGAYGVDGEVVPFRTLIGVVRGVCILVVDTRGRYGRTGRGLALGVEGVEPLIHGRVRRGGVAVHGVGSGVPAGVDARGWYHDCAVGRGVHARV